MIWRCGAILLAKRLAILTVPVSRGRRNVPIKLSPTQFYTTTFGYTFPFNSHVIPILFHHGLASHSQSILMFLSFSGWWFETFFIFLLYIGNNNPDWRTHIFQRGRYTTNQFWLPQVPNFCLHFSALPRCRNPRRHGPTTPTHAWRRMTGRWGPRWSWRASVEDENEAYPSAIFMGKWWKMVENDDSSNLGVPYASKAIVSQP